MSSLRRLVTGTNYCGPGGSGETLGEVDEACQEHDQSYTAPYLYDYLYSPQADTMFLQRLRTAQPRGIRQSVTKFVAQRYFTAKLRMSGYIQDPNEGRVLKSTPYFGDRQRAALERVNKKKLASIRAARNSMALVAQPYRSIPVYRRQVKFPYYYGRRKYAYKRRYNRRSYRVKKRYRRS